MQNDGVLEKYWDAGRVWMGGECLGETRASRILREDFQEDLAHDV